MKVLKYVRISFLGMASGADLFLVWPDYHVTVLFADLTEPFQIDFRVLPGLETWLSCLGSWEFEGIEDAGIWLGCYRLGGPENIRFFHGSNCLCWFFQAFVFGGGSMFVFVNTWPCKALVESWLSWIKIGHEAYLALSSGFDIFGIFEHKFFLYDKTSTSLAPLSLLLILLNFDFQVLNSDLNRMFRCHLYFFIFILFAFNVLIAIWDL